MIGTIRPSDLAQDICKAIEQRRLLRFNYKDRIRVVEPYMCGRDSSGHEMFTGWEVSAKVESGSAALWRTYRVDRIALLLLDEQLADKPRPGYNPMDDQMSVVYSRR